MRRDTGAKEDVPWEGLEERIKSLLDTIHSDMLEKARVERDACMAKITDWKDFIPALDQKKMVLAPWCDEKVRRSCSLTPR